MQIEKSFSFSCLSNVCLASCSWFTCNFILSVFYTPLVHVCECNLGRFLAKYLPGLNSIRWKRCEFRKILFRLVSFGLLLTNSVLFSGQINIIWNSKLSQFSQQNSTIMMKVIAAMQMKACIPKLSWNNIAEKEKN